jgi:hypothetical protein
MPSTINASTSSGIVSTADTSGVLELQSNGTTKLTVSSSGVNIGQMNGGAITSGTAVASTSGTSIDFTSIPSWVKKITVLWNGVSTNGTSNPIIQLGDSGGIEATGYLGAGSNMATGVATANYTTGFGVFGTAQWTAARVVYGGLTISNISGNTWVASGTWAASDDNQAGVTSGAKALSDTLTQIRITTVGGTNTFDAGTINIQYEG